MQIQIISQGSTALDRLMNKWGLSILIDQDILFDTFCSGHHLLSDLKRNQIDLTQIQHIVLSHEHWDHTGGLEALVKYTQNPKIYICKHFSEDFKKKIYGYGCEIIEVDESIKIKENVFSTGEIKGYYKEKVLYEQSLVLTTQNSVLVVTGCSHPGILNILRKVQSQHHQNIEFILGGLHLMNKDQYEIVKIQKALQQDYQIDKVAAFHCTGRKALNYFKKHMPEKMLKVKVGSKFLLN